MHRRATRVLPAGRAPLGPAIRPRPPALVRRTTARASRRRHRWSGRPYLSARLSSSRRPTPLPPLHRARRGRRLARLLATARVSSSPRTRSTSQGHTLPSVCPTPSREPRAVAGSAVGHRRAPSLGQPRPQLWARTNPRWPTGPLPPIPRPREPPASPDSGRPRRPTAKGGIASARVFLGCFP
jgi:hypothetical protein